jgi:phosphoglycolate phosphatase-like HAD superfamily hydrolase
MLESSFQWRDYDAYLFDIDGTLLNSRDAVHYDAFLSALRHLSGRELDLQGVTVQGSTDPIILLDALLLAGLVEDEVRPALPSALARMAAEVEARAAELRPELCPAVPQLLAELKNAGKVLGVTSGNLESIGWAKLKAAGIAEYFSFGSFSDRNARREAIFRWGAEQAQQLCGVPSAPAVGVLGRNSARVCFVGDTPADIAAAKACGFPVIAVATGIYSVVELACSGPELCIPACETLLVPSR